MGGLLEVLEAGSILALTLGISAAAKGRTTVPLELPGVGDAL